MDSQLQHLLRLINGDIDNPDQGDHSNPISSGNRDSELLDAYSRAVVSVVDSVGPAVVSISGAKHKQDQADDQVGAGSGVVIAPDCPLAWIKQQICSRGAVG
jgi:hypothetical protein